MLNRPMTDPRDQAVHAALRDAALLFAIVADELRASYRGARREVYRETLAAYVADLGGVLEETPDRNLVARVHGRAIAIRFD